MKHILRNAAAATLVIGLGVLIVGYAIRGGVPRAFLDARIRAAGAANNMAVLINNSIGNLSQIEQFEKNKSYDQALALLRLEVSQKQEKQLAGVLLATNLEEMAKVATTITSGGARNLALEGVTTGVSMVSRMVSYNTTLDQIFALIEAKIEDSGAPQEVGMRELISSINSDARAINELNNSFNETLKNLDARYGSDEE